MREGVDLEPAITGGGQERGWRSGTQNVALIAGMAAAIRLTVERRDRDNQQFARHRDRLINGILDFVPEARLTGHPDRRLPNNASFVFRGIDGNELLMRLDLGQGRGLGKPWVSSGGLGRSGKARGRPYI